MGPRFLIVEDDRNWGRLMANMVHSVVEPTVVASVKEAEALLSAKWSGAVIDVRLPDGCGLELAKRFRDADDDVELMLYTGDMSPRVVDEAARWGIVCADKALGFALLERFAAVCAKIARVDATTADRLTSLAERHGLTAREREIVDHELRGMTRVQIAAAMGITENTVRSVITDILRKTRHDRMAQLVATLVAATPSDIGTPT